MKRSDIFYKYLNDTLKREVGSEDVIEHKGIKYRVYLVKETGVRYLRAYRPGDLSDWGSMWCISEHGGDIIRYKYNIPSNIEGMPVVAIDNFADDNKNGKRFIIDLSESDLSNIIFIHGLNDKVREACCGLILPEEPAKRLRPVALGPMFGENLFSSEDIHRVLSLIDFSETEVLKNFFKDTLIESIDLDMYGFKSLKIAHDLFHECTKLKSVEGSFGCKELYSEGMFFGCSNLEKVGDRVFEGVKLRDLNYMFHGCRQLKELPIHTDNVKGYSSDGGIHYMFSACDRIDKDAAIEIVDRTLKKKRDSMCFYNCECDFIFGRHTITSKNLIGLFGGIQSCVVDIHKLQFLHRDILSDGLCMLFIRSGAHTFYNVSLSSALNSYYKDSQKVIDIIKTLTSLPKLLVVSRDMALSKYDRVLFNVIEMQGKVTDDDVRCKINIIKMLGGDDRYILVA